VEPRRRDLAVMAMIAVRVAVLLLEASRPFNTGAAAALPTASLDPAVPFDDGAAAAVAAAVFLDDGLPSRTRCARAT
jgi:hypothetical protein